MARCTLLALALTFAASLAPGCAEHDAAPPATPSKKTAPPSTTSSAAAQAPAAAPGHLSRAEVERVLRQGPPWLLRRVVPEEVIVGGKFVGWRLLSVPGDWTIDLKNGDVVTKVNGLSIERPDDLWAAWMQMQSAVELRIAYERDGKPREIVMPIDGPSAAGAQPTQGKEADAPPPPKPKSRWSTTVIGSDDEPPSE
jgi:hypothetical protein